MAIARIRLEETAVLIVDVQERLVPVMHEPEYLVAQVGRLMDAAAALGLPTLITEQYPKGLGATVPELAERASTAVCNHEKTRFSSCIDPVRDELRRRNIRTVLVAGIEAHVCVLQTCLDLAKAGYVSAVVVDAVSSRQPIDRDVALQRMAQAGVLPTTVESAVLEMVGEAGGERFKAVLPIVKNQPMR
ncbi:isochorismatase family protein [Phycisphaerales bacterium AB-hyl4]|uniref:Isochorismatase family protein n=1 Tax=Natronomicrosphaera hydrolytica TaxID=3242702 RepID=A0ABV4U2S6_9BACT